MAVTSWAFESLTLLTVNALVGWTTYADSLNAGAMVGAGGVDALTFLHVALCPLPPCQTHTPSFLIHPVPAAQHRAWICRTEWTQIRAAHLGGRACKHSLLQYMSCETAATYCERGYALLSQLGRRFSKSSSCLLVLSHTRTRTLICTYNHTHVQLGLSLTLFQFSQAPPEPGYHGNPGIEENPPKRHLASSEQAVKTIVKMVD